MHSCLIVIIQRIFYMLVYKFALTVCIPYAVVLCFSSHQVINLGKPSSQRPLKGLKGGNGVEIEYIEGGMCVMNGTHEIRYSTKLLLVCNRNVPIVSNSFKYRTIVTHSDTCVCDRCARTEAWPLLTEY